LNEALTAVASGDIAKLQQMVPYGPKGLGIEGQKAFEKSLDSMGFQVDQTGDAVRGFGPRDGSMTIAPKGSDKGIRLSYSENNSLGADAHPPKYKAEAVTVQSGGEGKPLKVTGASTNPESVREAGNAMVEQANKGIARPEVRREGEKGAERPKPAEPAKQ